MESISWVTELFNNFAIPVVMIIVFIAGIIALFKYYAKRDEKHDDTVNQLNEKHDNEIKELTEKYYEAYTKNTESNVRVVDALNNNTKVIEKLLDRLDK